MKNVCVLVAGLLTGCSDQQDEIVGQWGREDCPEHALCSFTIEKRENAVSNLYLVPSTDLEESMAGPLIPKKEIGDYVLDSGDGEGAIRYKNGAIYSKRGWKYTKGTVPKQVSEYNEKGFEGRWKINECDRLHFCEFIIGKAVDDKTPDYREVTLIPHAGKGTKIEGIIYPTKKEVYQIQVRGETTTLWFNYGALFIQDGHYYTRVD